MTQRTGRIAVALGLGAILTTPLAAFDLPRITLWRVEQTCILNQKTTGSPFPCLQVNDAGSDVVLRAPFRETHIVVMPETRVTGVEDPVLLQPGGPNYFAEAWKARSFVQAELKHTLGWDDVGLAVNSRLTRSQDQLHIHVDCVRRDVKRRLAAEVATMPTGAWMARGFAAFGQGYWTRLIDSPDLSSVNAFALAHEIPSVAAHPELLTIAVLGVTLPDGRNGFALLAGESSPHRGSEQSTAEDLLDHKCRRDA